MSINTCVVQYTIIYIHTYRRFVKLPYCAIDPTPRNLRHLRYPLNVTVNFKVSQANNIHVNIISCITSCIIHLQ